MRFNAVKEEVSIYGAALILLLLTGGCQSTAPPHPGGDVNPSAAEAGKAGRFAGCYELDSGASELRLLVYKTGPLARVGHNHVMVSHGLTGTLARSEPFSSTRAWLSLPVASLEVDPVDLRGEEGADFASEVSDEARAGTRSNMLGDGVLAADSFPEVQVELLSLTGPQWAADGNVRIRLKDQTRDQTVTLSLFEEGGGLRVVGSFSVLQTEFGMTPFSVLGGGLKVADEVKIRLNLRFNASEALSDDCR